MYAPIKDAEYNIEEVVHSDYRSSACWLFTSTALFLCRDAGGTFAVEAQAFSSHRSSRPVRFHLHSDGLNIVDAALEAMQKIGYTR
jgi:hypothetical protein